MTLYGHVFTPLSPSHESYTRLYSRLNDDGHFGVQHCIHYAYRETQHRSSSPRLYQALDLHR